MTEGRKAKLVIVVGATGTGKTTWLINLCKQIGYTNALAYVSELNIDDKVFKPFKTITELQAYTGGWAKLSDIDIEYKDLMQKVIGGKSTGYRNGAFIVDDAGEYEDEKVTDELKKLARMKRHISVDLFYIYHGLTDIPIQLFKYATDIVMFHTTDEPGYKLRKIPRAKELFAAKQTLQTMFLNGHQYQPIVLKLS